MKISDLKTNVNNPRRITDNRLSMLKKSLDKFGDLGCIVFNRMSGQVVGGNQRNKTFQPDIDITITQTYDPPTRTGTVAEGYFIVAGDKFKYREVSWDDQTEKAAMISANKQGGEWDYSALSNIILELDTANYDMDLIGYELPEIENIMTYDKEPLNLNNDSKDQGHLDASSSDKNEDEYDDVPEKIEPRVRVGDKYRIGNHQVLNGDCLEVLKTLQSNSIDSLVSDPPAGISFMNKSWDDDKGGSKEWIEWLSEVMKECLRVMKPGAHGFVWALPRTSHWTATAIEDAGFEIREIITHLFGQGFPKSLDISKQLDKQAAADRDIVGSNGSFPNMHGGKYGAHSDGKYEMGRSKNNITAPSAESAKKWQGYGTALKPASEHWILIRKPISENTISENVLKWGCGGLNIDGSRIGTNPGYSYPNGPGGSNKNQYGKYPERGPVESTQGRFPANLILSHNPDCVEVGVKKVGSGNKLTQSDNRTVIKAGTSIQLGKAGVHDPDNSYGTETVPAFECSEGCAVKLLDEQAGNRPSARFKSTKHVDTKDASIFGFGGLGTEDVNKYAGQQGGPSRFFYCSKPSKREKNEGLDSVEIINISYGPWENADLKVQLQVDTGKSVPKVIGVSGTWCNNASEWNMFLFGSDISEQLKSHFKSTIKIKTNLTIESKTLNWLVRLFTNVSIQDANLLMVNGGSLVDHAKSLSMCPNIIKDLMAFVTNAKCVLENVQLEIRSLESSSARNSHPTIKPTKLMSYLIKMITPPQGTIIDCFGGSGTTLVAAHMNGFNSILIEKETEYCDIILARAEHVTKMSAQS